MDKRGFTLIELIIVIAIIAILAGAMIPIFNVSRADAKVAKAKADLDVIKTAAAMLHADTSAWPPAGSAGLGLLTSNGIADWRGPYLDEWKADPWGSSFIIYTANPALMVQTLGANGAEGGAGYNADIEYVITPSY